jgi:hypothetical protein
VSWRGLELQGVLVEISPDGKATGIQIVRRACEGGGAPGDEEEDRE